MYTLWDALPPSLSPCTEEVMGIFITSLNPSGAAASDGRIQTGDRILKVDGHSLSGLENMEAAAVLRNSGNPIKMILGRKRRKALSPPDGSQPSVTPELPPPVLVTNGVQSPDQSHDQVGYHGNPEILSVERDGPKREERGEGKEEAEGDRMGGVGAEPVEVADKEEELTEKWSSILGPDYTIKVCVFLTLDINLNLHLACVHACMHMS